jgi:hypothetical protein
MTRSSRALDPATLPDPERLTTDDGAVRAAWRYPSASTPGRTYDVALSPEGYWSCECFPFLEDDACVHLEALQLFFRRESARNERQAQLDWRLGCRHPLTVEEWHEDGNAHRVCVGCGAHYDRSTVRVRLEADIRERHRLPASPWSAAERSEDPS